MLLSSDQFRLDTKDDSFQLVLDLILNLGIFLWIGATIPWRVGITGQIVTYIANYG